jgi:hypothetical protein
MSIEMDMKREVEEFFKWWDEIHMVRSLPKVIDPEFDEMMRSLRETSTPTKLFPNPPIQIAPDNNKIPDLIHLHDRYYTYENDKYVRKSECLKVQGLEVLKG